MKRDLDLARQLLLDIENRGTDCSVSVLRSGPNHQSEEQIRYHLRLLIDAELLKEIDRTSAGIPCVRLTHEGHELLELARSEPRWREAKYVCQERIGGLSLTVIRGIMLRWAVNAASRAPRYRRAPIARRVRHETDLPRERTAYHIEPHRAEPYPVADRLIEGDLWQEENFRYDDFCHDQSRHDQSRYDQNRYVNGRYVNVRPEYDEYRSGRSRYGVDLDGDGRVDVEYDTTLPGYLL